ncbi:phosphotransferase family protein [Marivita sp. S0852]|uniref:phosphotransferase family protein n=1 Tax=Marivita sp. S0852 TaxID=3373893 RepID=UPI003982D5BC
MTAPSNRWHLRRRRIEELAGLSPAEWADGPYSIHHHHRSGTRVFVKAMNRALPGFGNEVAAARMLVGLSLAVPVVEVIDDPAAGCAIIFAHRDLSPLGTAPEDARAMGRALRGLHDHGARTLAEDPAAFGTPPVTLAEVLARSMSRLPRTHPEAPRLTRLATRALAEDGLAAYGGACALVHGDFGLRNVGRLPDDTLCVFDFEHARAGHPILDFAKLWDRELAAPPQRAAFLAGYGDGCAGLPLTDEMLWPVRLWAVIGIMLYCSRIEDAHFRAHGQSLLDRLDREVAHHA